MKFFVILALLVSTFAQAESFTKKECESFVNRLDQQARQAERLSLKFLEAGALTPELVNTPEEKNKYAFYSNATSVAENKVDALKQKLLQCLK